jgi:hypothetical protein
VEAFLDEPLEDLLHALRHQLRERATEKYYVESQMHAAIAPYAGRDSKPPALPEILRA